MGIRSNAATARIIFTTALKLSSDAARENYLIRSCGQDTTLLRHVRKLLAASDHEQESPLHQASQFETPQQPIGDSLLTITSAARDEGDSPTPSAVHHSRIGPYEIRRLIGEGGMGNVYAADQSAPIRRRVALKLIKPGMDTREVVARFEAERQALAMMDHPNIAKVLDAGTTENGNLGSAVSRDRSDNYPWNSTDVDPGGRPYFVMELVDGLPMTRYCNESKLAIDDRLALFVDICQAVQHAHDKGIIHRDLKPTNLLVATQDGVPVPKVIDFGVAKALTSRLTEKTLHTGDGRMLGTPLYMAPEQTDFASPNVDIKSDVYSLGVVLYELLAGSTPFDRKTLHDSGLDEFWRIVREVDPAPPSARIASLPADDREIVSQERRSDGGRLGALLRNELDWIVLKALEKDPGRRYESAAAFAADIQRYLTNQPVEACPPSTWYRFRKYYARHRVILTATLCVLLALVTGTAVSVWQAVEAHRARQVSEDRFAEANRQKQIAEGLRTTADAQRDDARLARDRSRTLLYAAEMKLANDALAQGDVLRASALLERHAGEKDLIGFEWHYLKQRITVPMVRELNHNAWVNDIAASFDETRIATASGPVVRVFDTKTWKLQCSFSTLFRGINGVAWSRDGRLLAAACSDGRLRVWNVHSESLLKTITAHEGEANDLIFSPDGNSLYSCGDDGLAKKWQINTAKLELTFKGHQREVEQIALAPSGKRLVTAGSDRAACLWDTESGRRLHRRNFNVARLACVAFSPDGRHYSVADIIGHLYRVETRSGEYQMLNSQNDGVESLAFSPNGKFLFTADRSGTLQQHRVLNSIREAAGSPYLRWIGHAGRAVSIETIRNGQLVITGGRDGACRVWKPDWRAARWTVLRKRPQYDVAAGPRDRIFVVNSKIETWDLNQREQVATAARTRHRWWEVEVSRNGKYLAAVSTAGKLVLLNPDDGRRALHRWKLGKDYKPHCTAVSPNGRFVAVTDYHERLFVNVYGRDSTTNPRRLPARQCNALAFSPDGRWLVAGHMDDLRLFDLHGDNSDHREWKGHSNSLNGVAFSPDGTLLATVSDDRLLKVREFPSGKERFSIAAHRDRVNTVTFSPDGKTIATGCDKGEVKLWHTATGQPLGTIARESGSIRKLCFSWDGRRLVCRTRGLVLVYDAGH